MGRPTDNVTQKAGNTGATMSVATGVMSRTLSQRTLSQEIQQEKPFVSVEEEVFLGLIGSDGSIYYTADHFATFKKVEPK